MAQPYGINPIGIAPMYTIALSGAWDVETWSPLSGYDWSLNDYSHAHLECVSRTPSHYKDILVILKNTSWHSLDAVHRVIQRVNYMMWFQFPARIVINRTPPPPRGGGETGQKSGWLTASKQDKLLSFSFSFCLSSFFCFLMSARDVVAVRKGLSSQSSPFCWKRKEDFIIN